MSFTAAIPLLVLIAFPVINAIEMFYQPVNGKCSDLHAVRSYDDQKIASGDWYQQYVSYGEQAAKCASGHAVERGNTNYVDFLIYDTEKKRYEMFPDDLKYHPDLPGVYTNSKGANGFIIGSDVNSYLYYVQCLEENGKVKVMVLFQTRQRKITATEEKIYKTLTAKLGKTNLLPKMFKMSQKDCPPEYNLKIEKPAAEFK